MKRLSDTLFALALVLPVMPAWAEEEAHAGGLPQFNPHWWPGQMAWLIVIFGVLYLFFAVKTLPEIGGTLEKRRAKIEGDLKAAEALHRQATEAQESYEKLIGQTRHEAAQLLHDAGLALKEEGERRNQALKSSGETQMQDLERELATLKQQAKNELQKHIAELAGIAAAKIVGLQPDMDRAHALVQTLRGTEAA